MTGQDHTPDISHVSKTVTVCVGSSCHVKGAREVINKFNHLLKQHNLSDTIELKGSFCMERCGKGINWQIDDTPVTSDTADDAVNFFIQQIISPLKGKVT